jgi:hypothetical protein
VADTAEPQRPPPSAAAIALASLPLANVPVALAGYADLVIVFAALALGAMVHRFASTRVACEMPSG